MQHWINPKGEDAPVDEALLHALRQQKDRGFVLNLEKLVWAFLRSPGKDEMRGDETLSFPVTTFNYYRMLAHKVAQYYQLRTCSWEGPQGAQVLATWIPGMSRENRRYVMPLSELVPQTAMDTPEFTSAGSAPAKSESSQPSEASSNAQHHPSARFEIGMKPLAPGPASHGPQHSQQPYPAQPGAAVQPYAAAGYGDYASPASSSYAYAYPSAVAGYGAMRGTGMYMPMAMSPYGMPMTPAGAAAMYPAGYAPMPGYPSTMMAQDGSMMAAGGSVMGYSVPQAVPLPGSPAMGSAMMEQQQQQYKQSHKKQGQQQQKGGAAYGGAISQPMHSPQAYVHPAPAGRVSAPHVAAAAGSMQNNPNMPFRSQQQQQQYQYHYQQQLHQQQQYQYQFNKKQQQGYDQQHQQYGQHQQQHQFSRTSNDGVNRNMQGGTTGMPRAGKGEAVHKQMGAQPAFGVGSGQASSQVPRVSRVQQPSSDPRGMPYAYAVPDPSVGSTTAAQWQQGGEASMPHAGSEACSADTADLDAAADPGSAESPSCRGATVQLSQLAVSNRLRRNSTPSNGVGSELSSPSGAFAALQHDSGANGLQSPRHSYNSSGSLPGNQGDAKREAAFGAKAAQMAAAAAAAIILKPGLNGRSSPINLAIHCPPGHRRPPPESVLCPISGKVMKDPVIVLASGYTYDRASVEALMQDGKGNDPKTGAEFDAAGLVPNMHARTVVQEWVRLNPEPEARVSLASALTAAASDGSLQEGGYASSAEGRGTDGGVAADQAQAAGGQTQKASAEVVAAEQQPAAKVAAAEEASGASADNLEGKEQGEDAAA